MKPTISIFEDEIVITTDSFDLILKTGAERKAQSEDPEPLTDWDNDPFAPSTLGLNQAIDDYKEQHPEQFASISGIPQKIKYTDQRIVNVPVEKAVVYTPAEIAPVKHTRNLSAKPCKICGNEFKPTWNTQHYCPACKPKYYGQKRKPLAEQTAEELEKTLQDIENRRKKPYEFK